MDRETHSEASVHAPVEAYFEAQESMLRAWRDVIRSQQAMADAWENSLRAMEVGSRLYRPRQPARFDVDRGADSRRATARRRGGPGARSPEEASERYE